MCSGFSVKQVQVYPNDDVSSCTDAIQSQIAKRSTAHSPAKQSWNAYNTICRSILYKQQYEDSFRMLQKEPIFPYLNAMQGINDGPEESATQINQRKYLKMTRKKVAQDLAKRATKAMPELVKICKKLSKVVGFTQIGV
eukprot:11283401-Ditylum_brightwellii.AAC.1